MFHPGILRPTSSGEDYWTWRTEDEDPTVDRSVLLCRSEGEIFWHNMNSLDKIAIAMNNNKYINVSMQLVEIYFSVLTWNALIFAWY